MQTECRRCGTCCLKGGPALHREDIRLVTEGTLPMDRLITIRRGELVNHPLTGKIQTTPSELVKIRGTGTEWRCCFYREIVGCTIYRHRPLACRVLKCWNPEEISALVGKDVASRQDILDESHPLRTWVEEHERRCPCPDMGHVRGRILDNSLSDLEELQQIVDADLDFRNRAVRQLKLSVADELFYFGRPLFQLLQALGIGIAESEGRIVLLLARR